MTRHDRGFEIELISTCPASSEAESSGYRERVAEVARWSERWGCSASLVYTDNRQLDPWMVSQMMVEDTETLAPLVAVQPVYTHPYTIAKLVTTFGNLFGRRVYLNMVAGGFKKDLEALNDPTPHDRRYDRLVEYTRIVQDLLKGGPVTFEGDFYTVRGLSLTPELPPDLYPELFMSGSSEAGRKAADLLDARPVSYPKPPGEQGRAPVPPSRMPGLRIGIIAREDRNDAWKLAHQRFPPDREGQLTRQLARKASDSVWHEELSRMAEERAETGDPYWLVPFENYKTMCPYLVGSYDDVGQELADYVSHGYRTFLLDIPRSEEDLEHARSAFDRALEGAVAA